MALTNPQRKKLFIRVLTKWFTPGGMTDAQRAAFAADVGAAIGSALDVTWLEPEKAAYLADLGTAKTSANSTISTADAEIASLA